MNEQDLLRSVAKFLRGVLFISQLTNQVFWRTTDEQPASPVTPREYLEVMHLAEESLTADETAEYLTNLVRITGDWIPFDATFPQRAEAFLAVKSSTPS